MDLYTYVSIPQTIAVLTCMLILIWVAKGTYRIYFHPLSKYPGPKFSAFTTLSHFTVVSQGNLHNHLRELHEKYGEVVRIAPNELSFVSPDAWRDIHGHGLKGTEGTVPPKAFSRYPKPANGSPSILVEEDDSEHARTRRIFSPAFSDRALAEQEPVFVEYADQLVDVLKRQIHDNSSSAIDMVKMLNLTAFDIMADMTFGEPLHMLDNAAYDPWVRTIFRYVKVGARMNILSTYYPRVFGLLKLVLGTKMQKTRMDHFQHSATRVTKRIEQGRQTAGTDLWTYVLGQTDKGKEGLSRADMDANASLFMVAGTESIATVLSGLTYMLLTTPSTLHTLTTELRSAFPSASAISMAHLARLPYLNACIKEALRLYPPVPVGLLHRTPATGSTICSHYVPPGVTVSAPHLPMYTSSDNFAEPLSFAPERWMGDERFGADRRAVLQPFSVGARDCLGKNMAYHEMRVILAKVLWSFDLELCEGQGDWMEQKVFLVWEKKPLAVKLTVWRDDNIATTKR